MNQIHINVFNATSSDSACPFRGNLSDMISWMQEKLAKVPEPYRQNAIFEIQSEIDRYDCPFATIDISYHRPETDAEIAARTVSEKECKNRKREAEIAAARKTLEKYGENR